MPGHIIINGRGSGKVGISDEPQPENNAEPMRRPTRVNQIKFRSSLWRKLRETQGKLKETVQTKPRGGGGGKAMMRLRAEETQTKTNGQMAA